MPLNDDRLREVLPLLRPRSAEPTLFSQTVFYLLWLGLGVIVGLYFFRLYRLRQRRRQEFLEAGAKAGLSQAQATLLLGIAGRLRLTAPVRLLHSAHTFDRQVGRYASRLAKRALDHPQLDQIARIRQDLGFDAIPVDQALSSTRLIERGQTVMVRALGDDGDGDDAYAPWLVLERDEGSLVLAPLLREEEAAPVYRPRRGDDLAVRFWREGDTEYRFSTEVLERVGEAGAVRVEHTSRLDRTQHRDFYRIDVDFPAHLFILAADDRLEGAEQVRQAAALRLLDDAGPGPHDSVRVEETAPAARDLTRATVVRGRIANLSAGGFAMRVDADAPSAPPGAVWLVDPAFEGDFPLAGLSCRLVGDEPGGGGRTLKLRFDGLPTAVEKEIVRGVYQRQLTTAGRSVLPASAGDLPEEPPQPPSA